MVQKQIHLLALEKIEKDQGIHFPEQYKQWISKQMQSQTCCEIFSNGSSIYLFPPEDLLERNATYQIHDVLPQGFMIGQDGDMGYFIRVRDKILDETIYCLDLGALGSLELEIAAPNINDLCYAAQSSGETINNAAAFAPTKDQNKDL